MGAYESAHLDPRHQKSVEEFLPVMKKKSKLDALTNPDNLTIYERKNKSALGVSDKKERDRHELQHYHNKLSDTRWLDNLQNMPKYRGYHRHYLQETMVDQPRREQASKDRKEKEELDKMDE